MYQLLMSIKKQKSQFQMLNVTEDPYAAKIKMCKAYKNKVITGVNTISQ